uniref:(northern house mosquito) hypothetical protein n=1 Tax=Culex pipiens TaxID=7175 RepID=A0A8D8JX65_CULPI
MATCCSASPPNRTKLPTDSSVTGHRNTISSASRGSPRQSANTTASSTVTIRPSWTCLNPGHTAIRCSSMPLLTSHALSVRYCSCPTRSVRQSNPLSTRMQLRCRNSNAGAC